jgi:SAM-dependent methyltransferase
VKIGYPARAMLRDSHEQNRRSWNHATRAHNSHKRDQAGFLRDGGSTLFPDELELLGVPPAAWPKEHVPKDLADAPAPARPLAGVDLVHLQCNAGQDSLSLARLGARVTGVDISDEAIAAAEALAQGSGIPARFVRSDLYDWFAAADERFDVAFASYGAVGWLSDLNAWAAGVAGVLRPGGRLVLLEFHPVAFVFDEQLRPTYPYFGDGRPQVTAGIGDYVAASGDGLTPSGREPGVVDFLNPEPCHEFAWSVGQLVTAVAGAGLVVEQLREYPYANGCKIYAQMRELPGRRWATAGGLPDMPLMLGLTARKPA